MHVTMEDAEKVIAAAQKASTKIDTKMCIAVVELRRQSESLPTHG